RAPRGEAPGGRHPARRRPHVRCRRAVGGGEAPHPDARRHVQQPRLLQRLGAPDPHGEAARHAGGARLHRHGHGRSGAGLRRARQIARLVRRRPDPQARRRRAGAQARDRQGESRAAGARRHDHAEEMNRLGKIGTVPVFFIALMGCAWAQPVVNVYSSMGEKDLRRLVGEFERRQGVKVNLWRSGKNRILERVLREARAGRHEVDVIHNPAPEMEALHNERLLRRVDSPRLAELIAQAVAPHREWAGPRVYIFVQAYNTTKVKRDELPRSYGDLLDARWKGRVAIEGKEQEWFFTLVQAMGEAAGLKFFRELAANGMQVRLGNALLTNLVVAGDVPFALTLYSYLPEQQRRAGAPVNWIALKPTIAATD